MNRKKILSLLISIAMIVCMIPGEAFADNSISCLVGNSNVTISADRDLNNLVLPSDRGLGGIEVDFVITSDNVPVSSISIGGFSMDYSSNRVEYKHLFTETDSSKSVLTVTLADGASASFGFFVRPAKLISKEITILTDPTGMKISGFDFPARYGSRLYVEVYKDSAMKNRLASFNTPLKNGPVAIHKKGHSWYKPNTTYYLKIYGAEAYQKLNGEVIYLPGDPIKRTVKTSPAVNPVVKSVKISNIKVQNLSTLFVKKYHTTYTMTITLSKKASNIKGIKVFAAGNYYTVKGNGKTFKVRVSNITDRSYKGMKTNYRLCTYGASDSVGGAYSTWTKSKTYVVR